MPDEPEESQRSDEPRDPRPSRRSSRFLPWQATIAAAVAGVATVAAALIAAIPHGTDPSPGPTKVAISSWSQHSAGSSGTTYVLSGTTTADDGVYVVVRLPSGSRADTAPPSDEGGTASGGARWLVSPPAEIFRGGRWKVTWTLHTPPTAGSWVAVAMKSSCPQGGACSPDFAGELRDSGPGAVDAVAVGKAPSASPGPR